jgi:AcrR family transcriptional regulator
MPKSPTTPRRRRNTAEDRAELLNAALDETVRMIDADGVEAFSMRRLAQELGVGSMTLYHYVRDRDEILEAAASRVLTGLHHAPPANLPWRQRISIAIRQLHVVLLEHPGVLNVIWSRPGLIPALDGFRESMLAILRDAGFSTQDAVDGLTALLCFALGYAQIERARREVIPEEQAARLRGLRRDQYPRLTEAADQYAHQITDHVFENGLKSIIDGFPSDRADDLQV